MLYLYMHSIKQGKIVCISNTLWDSSPPQQRWNSQSPYECLVRHFETVIRWRASWTINMLCNLI